VKQTETLIFKTNLGWVGLAAAENGSTVKICHIVLPRLSKRIVEQKLGAMQHTKLKFTKRYSPHTPLLSPHAREVVKEARRQVEEFFAGSRRELEIPVDLSAGTPFQRRVWKVLYRIPYGRVRSYKWVAARVGGSRYARAVGMALGANPVPIAIPCHRVVAHDGSLGGFGGGLILKRRLLDLEGTLPLLRRGKR
jgi:O-6-methylguanine DNA methyltransferase